MKKVQAKEKLALIMLLTMLVTNPLTGQYVQLGIELVFQHLFIYGAWVSIVGTSYLFGLMAFYYAKSQDVKLPAKGKSTKTQAYIET